MKKQRRASKQKKSRKAATPTAAPAEPARRDVLKLLRNGGIAAVVLGAGGYFSVSSVRATMAEHDLTRIGQGRPAVVQIHDPNCALCTALQKEARRALRRVGSDQLDYVIANIRTTEGRAYANRHRVQHVTLLLVDGAGEVQQVLAGSNKADVLEDAFAAHLAQHGS